MSYENKEVSVSSGQPVELYDFVRGNEYYYYTTHTESVTYLSNVYRPSSALRTPVMQSNDTFKNDVKFTFPRTNDFALSFVKFALEDICFVTIRRYHLGDSEYIPYWKGRVLGAELTDNSIELVCESSFSTLKRHGLRARYEYNCRHALYSENCGANKDSFDATGNIISISDNKLTLEINEAALQVDGYYTGGFALIAGVRRFITGHVGNLVELNSAFESISIGQQATLYAGCDHKRTTCNSKFSNILNFGGFPFIPTKNPFNTSIY